MKPRILVLANQKSENYVQAIESCGGIATLKYLPDSDVNFDGLLLCGGNDISPSYYGQKIDGAYNLDQRRDETELELTRNFIDTGKPIFGICRGHQLLNVALGGTLIQNLTNADFHRAQNGADNVHKIKSEGFLNEIYNGSFNVNSAHHQGIDKLGKGLIASAWCENVIEAIQHSSKPYIGVQFHPERMCLKNTRGDTVDGIKIFEYFMELCKRR